MQICTLFCFFTYDVSGNRISKQVGSKTTFYVRDASGNVMAIYEKGNNEINSGKLSEIEVDLYGSSRLGMLQRNLDVESTNWWLFETTAMPGTNGGRMGVVTMGITNYELSNHLGNVLVTVSDRKIQVQDPNNTTQTLYYNADVVTANDYYPGGMDMPGRQYNAATGYRYGFNGKEKDTEGPVQYDYGFRIYDPRLVRFKSVDPLTHKYAMLTPYQFASNTPIVAVDLDGKEKLEAFFLLDKSNSGEVVTSGATAAQISFDVKTKTISAVYGKVDGNGLKISYNIESKSLSVVEGKITTGNIVDAYGQVGTKYTKGQIRSFISLHNFLENIGLSKDLRGFEKSLAEFDTKSWEALKEKGLEDLHTSASSLLDGFLKSDLRLQVIEKGGSDIYRIFDNEGRDLSAIEVGLKLKLALLQVEIPPVEKPKENKPIKPLDLIDKRPITDHPEDTKWKRDALEREKMKKQVEEKKKEN